MLFSFCHLQYKSNTCCVKSDMSSSSNSKASKNIRQYCDRGLLDVIKTSRTNNNPDRRFYGCTNYGVSSLRNIFKLPFIVLNSCYLSTKHSSCFCRPLLLPITFGGSTTMPTGKYIYCYISLQETFK